MQLNLENATSYHYDQFPPKKLNYEQFLTAMLEATDALARYDQMLKNLHNSEIFLAPLRAQEAVISSRMEGSISTLDEILQYEADYQDEDSDSAEVRHDVIETILYRRALQAAQNALEDGYPFSKSFIKSIHQKLLSIGRGASKLPGDFKTEQNYIAEKHTREILFIPISPEKLNDGLDNLIDYISNSEHQPLIRTAMTHVEFEALHPFKDGNGRIGRMLITLMLWRSGAISAPHFYISGYMEDNKDLYIDTMRSVSANGDWDRWCAFFMEAIKQQAIRNLTVTESINQLYDEMKARLADVLSSKWSVNALDFLFTNPIFRNNRFTSQSGIPAATAARFTRALLENNIIVTIQESAGRRPALYSFEPLMELVRV